MSLGWPEGKKSSPFSTVLFPLQKLTFALDVTHIWCPKVTFRIKLSGETFCYPFSFGYAFQFRSRRRHRKAQNRLMFDAILYCTPSSSNLIQIDKKRMELFGKSAIKFNASHSTCLLSISLVNSQFSR